jgi:hypothetical protein
MGVNRPSIESSDLTTARKSCHTQPRRKEKRQEEWAIKGADARERGRRTLEKYRVSDSREEGE